MRYLVLKEESGEDLSLEQALALAEHPYEQIIIIPETEEDMKSPEMSNWLHLDDLKEFED